MAIAGSEPRKRICEYQVVKLLIALGCVQQGIAIGRYRQGAKQDLNPWGVVRGAGFDYSIFRVKIQFKYYLHDDASFFERLEDLQAQSHLFTEELVEKMGRPFYEVTLQCEVDTDTGSVTILSTK